MIEVNVKAKPYNPAESVIGSDLLMSLAEAQLVGWHYFCDQPPADKGKSVLGIAAPGKYNVTLKKLKNAGWIATGVHGQVTQYQKGNDNGLMSSFFMAESWDTYEKWCDAAEVCKLLGITYSEANKKMVKFIHQVVVDGFKVTLDKDGQIVKVAAPPPKKFYGDNHHEEHFPELAPAGLGGFAQGAPAVNMAGQVNPAPQPFGMWAALHPGQAIQQQAAAAAHGAFLQAEVQAQIEADQLQQAGMADNNGG